MPSKLSHERAAAEMRSYNAEPTERYPGLNSPWSCVCLLCQARITPRLKYVRRFGRPCLGCSRNPRRTSVLDDGVARAVMIAAGLIPLERYNGSKTPWRCRCVACGREITPRYNTVHQNKQGCRYCGIERRARYQMRDSVAMEAEYRRLGGIPAVSYTGVDELWPGTCSKCKRPLARTWKAIEKSGYFCTFCSGERVIPEQAFAAMLSAGCTPLEPYTFSDARWRCQCHKCFRTIYPSYDSIKRGQTPCAYCAHRLVDPDEARQLLIDAGAIPKTTFPGALRPWPSVCSRCAEEVTPVYNAVLKGHDPCRYCSGNRISTTDAVALAAAADLEPLDEYQQAGEVWLCRCTRCGSTARTVLTRLKFAGARGCPVCKRGGFRAHEPACIYLLYNAASNTYKIGVTNQHEFRIREHRRYGFTSLQLADGTQSIWPIEIGERALAIENAVLTLWRVKLRLPQALAPKDMPQNGATETAQLGPAELQMTLDLLRRELPSESESNAVA